MDARQGSILNYRERFPMYRVPYPHYNVMTIFNLEDNDGLYFKQLYRVVSKSKFKPCLKMPYATKGSFISINFTF